jgi:hypothetical protein
MGESCWRRWLSRYLRAFQLLCLLLLLLLFLRIDTIQCYACPLWMYLALSI